MRQGGLLSPNTCDHEKIFLDDIVAGNCILDSIIEEFQENFSANEEDDDIENSNEEFEIIGDDKWSYWIQDILLDLILSMSK